MALKVIREGLIELDGRFRAEIGPRRVEAVATPEALSDEVTASHYQEGRFDAMGKTIVKGKPFTYLDWKNRKINSCWYIYALDDDGVWVERSTLDGDQGAAASVLKTMAEAA